MGRYQNFIANNMLFLIVFTITVSCYFFGAGNANDQVKQIMKPKESDLITRFNENYNKWQQYISKPEVKISSNSSVYINNEPFRRIINMGEEALPLIIEKMKNGKNENWNESQFFLWHAARDITGKDLSDKNKFESEQMKAEKYIIWWQQGMLGSGAK